MGCAVASNAPSGRVFSVMFSAAKWFHASNGTLQQKCASGSTERRRAKYEQSDTSDES